MKLERTVRSLTKPCKTRARGSEKIDAHTVSRSSVGRSHKGRYRQRSGRELHCASGRSRHTLTRHVGPAPSGLPPDVSLHLSFGRSGRACRGPARLGATRQSAPRHGQLRRARDGLEGAGARRLRRLARARLAVHHRPRRVRVVRRGAAAGVARDAAARRLQIQVGTWSICPTSKAFKPKWGTAEEHLALGIRVARAVGSPVIRVVLGTWEDRLTDGGIDRAHRGDAEGLPGVRGRGRSTPA